MSAVAEELVRSLSGAGTGWREFLAGMLSNDWAVGSWDPGRGVLTIDPFNELNDFKVCDRPGCANPAARVAFCQSCVRRAKAAGLPVGEYARTRPKVDPLEGRSTRGFALCGVHDEEGRRCGRAQTTRGLCPSHYYRFTKNCKALGMPVTDEMLAAFITDRRGESGPPLGAMPGAGL